MILNLLFGLMLIAAIVFLVTWVRFARVIMRGRIVAVDPDDRVVIHLALRLFEHNLNHGLQLRAELDFPEVTQTPLRQMWIKRRRRCRELAADIERVDPAVHLRIHTVKYPMGEDYA
jgi:hypothetical protein